jgi:hypothetical protein
MMKMKLTNDIIVIIITLRVHHSWYCNIFVLQSFSFCIWRCRNHKIYWCYNAAKKQCDIALNLAKTAKTNYFLCNDRFKISKLRDILSKKDFKTVIERTQSDISSSLMLILPWCHLLFYYSNNISISNFKKYEDFKEELWSTYPMSDKAALI